MVHFRHLLLHCSETIYERKDKLFGESGMASMILLAYLVMLSGTLRLADSIEILLRELSVIHNKLKASNADLITLA